MIQNTSEGLGHQWVSIIMYYIPTTLRLSVYASVISSFPHLPSLDKSKAMQVQQHTKIEKLLHTYMHWFLGGHKCSATPGKKNKECDCSTKGSIYAEFYKKLTKHLQYLLCFAALPTSNEWDFLGFFFLTCQRWYCLHLRFGLFLIG